MTVEDRNRLLMEQYFAALNRDDVAATEALRTPDCSMHTNVINMKAEPEVAAAYLASIHDRMEYEIVAREVLRIVATATGAAAVTRTTARSRIDGAEVSSHSLCLVDIENGLISAVWSGTEEIAVIRFRMGASKA